MNICSLIGRLTADPKMSYIGGSQMAICKFTLAVDRNGKDKGADFPRVTVFGKQAESCEKYLAKGRQVGIVGRIQTGGYEKSDGTKVYTTDVIADRVEFLSGGEKREAQTSIADTFESIDADVPF